MEGRKDAPIMKGYLYLMLLLAFIRVEECHLLGKDMNFPFCVLESATKTSGIPY